MKGIPSGCPPHESCGDTRWVVAPPSRAGRQTRRSRRAASAQPRRRRIYASILCSQGTAEAGSVLTPNVDWRKTAKVYRAFQRKSRERGRTVSSFLAGGISGVYGRFLAYFSNHPISAFIL